MPRNLASTIHNDPLYKRYDTAFIEPNKNFDITRITQYLNDHLLNCLHGHDPKIGYVQDRMTWKLNNLIRDQILINNYYGYNIPQHPLHDFNYISVVDDEINSFIYIESLCDDEWYLVSLTHPADLDYNLWKCDQISGVVAFIKRLYNCN